MLSIKVLGPGCANCIKVEAIARQAIAKLGIEADIEKITAYPEMMKYGILSTPGLVINEKLVLAGHLPNEAEVIRLLERVIAA